MITVSARIRVSGEIARFLIYIAMIGIIGGILTSITGVIKEKFVRRESTKRWLDRLEWSIWLLLFLLGILDIFGIFPTYSRLLRLV